MRRLERPPGGRGPGGIVSQARPGPEHARLAPFVGRWKTAGEVLAGPSSFFLLHRVDVRIGGERVQVLEVIGWDAERGSYFMRSFDSQGGAGVMEASERDGVWSFAGDAERFTGGFGDSGRTLSGRWERREGDRWIPWMDVRLTKGGE